MITPIFYVWKFKEVQFLAVERGTDVHIVDDQGGNYGSWRTADEFRKRQQRGDDIAKPLDGPRTHLAVRLS